ncbi:MAG: thioredoxin domain-containing protein [Elusimicrobiales bacterium]|nr:thioredoxin domain-containing protein [Elusimicrobiales bacterium]
MRPVLNKTNARLAALAGAVLFTATVAVLLARQYALGPARPAPDFRTFGPPGAPVRIEEYSDFACGACRGAADKLNEALKVYPGKLRVELKHYPLSNIHPWSLQAAAYADCAGARGKFKEYAALLFEGQENWGEAKAEPGEFRDYAGRLGLDWEELKACSNDPKTLKALKLDIAEAELKGVNATPTFFINGKRAVGPAQLLEQLRKLDKLLAADGAGR